MTGQLIPMLAPDGTPGYIPQERVQDALKAGGKMGVGVIAPDGTPGIVPQDRMQDALSAGARLTGGSQLPNAGLSGPSRPNVDPSQEQANIPGVMRTLAQDPMLAYTPVHGLASIPTGIADYASTFSQSADPSQVNARRWRAGTDVLTGGMSLMGPAVAGSAVTRPIGTGLVLGAADLLGRGVSRGATALGASPEAAETLGTAAPAVALPFVPRMAKALNVDARVKPQAAVVPEAANLPPAAVSGAERIFRAAAPVGSDPQFRANLYASAGDLAEIGHDIRLREASGGIINPDMRVRATVDAINDHLTGPQGMYQTERAPQIQRNANAQVLPKFSADAAAGLDYMARNAGTTADRSLAGSVLTNQETMRLSDADVLARAVNRELSPLRGMTPQELAVAEGNSKRFASLQALDKELSAKIGAELSNRGEPGISAYERRYAALSSVRDQLQSRMNAVELQRSNPLARGAGALVKVLTGGKTGIASASQAAVADVNIGRELQMGFQELAQSGIAPNRPTGTGAPRVRGLLGPGATQLPSAMEPIGQPSPAPPTLDYIPSTQNPRKFVGPGEIRPAGQVPSLLPGGDLFQVLINRRGGR